MPRKSSFSALALVLGLSALSTGAVAAQPVQPPAPPVTEQAPPHEPPLPPQDPPQEAPPPTRPPVAPAPPAAAPAPAPALMPPPEPSGALFDLKDGPPTRFGNRGQCVLDAGSLASVALSTLKVSGAKANRTDLAIHPALGYFVIDRLLFELELDYGRTTQDQGIAEDVTDTVIGGGLGTGFDLELGAQTSLLPALTARYRHYVAGERPGLADQVTQDEIVLVLAAHFLFHPVPHFFIGVGPNWSFSVYERHDQLQSVSTTRFSADAIIGVWW